MTEYRSVSGQCLNVINPFMLISVKDTNGLIWNYYWTKMSYLLAFQWYLCVWCLIGLLLRIQIHPTLQTNIVSSICMNEYAFQICFWSFWHISNVISFISLWFPGMTIVWGNLLINFVIKNLYTSIKIYMIAILET